MSTEEGGPSNVNDSEDLNVISEGERGRLSTTVIYVLILSLLTHAQGTILVRREWLSPILRVIMTLHAILSHAKSYGFEGDAIDLNTC